MGVDGERWACRESGGPWSHGYHYYSAFYVNTGLGQRGLIVKRGGGRGGGVWHMGR